MKLVNRVEIKLDGFDKCSFTCDSDAPLGSLYDYTTSLMGFIVEKMKSVEEAKKQSKPEEVVPQEAPKE